MYEKKPAGWMELICGSMFSGKSEELIRRVRRTQFARQKTVVFKPAIDNRYAEEAVVSHNGTSVWAKSIVKSTDIFDHVDEQLDVIAIDEVQFFDEEIVEVAQQLADSGYRVILAGLDQDFRGEPFGPVPKLLSLAESVTKLQAVCAVCGRAASRTQRLINDRPANYHDPIILVGASEAYEPRCRHHHEVPGRDAEAPCSPKEVNNVI